MKISATIITLNEQKNIKDCLESLDFADEIVVVDSGSVDQTEEICRSYQNVRFFQHAWQGYGKQKNKAAELAANKWIINIDADERVSPELASNILSAEYSRYNCFKMTRRNFFGKRWVKHCGWYPDYTARLYNSSDCSFSERPVHESLVCDGAVGVLSGDLLHFSYDGIGDYLQRMNRYSSLAAQELYERGYTSGVKDLISRPIATFLRMYLLKKGFLDGSDGLVLSSLYAFYTFSKYAKARELVQERLHD